MHEIGHAIGFYHEHQRADRDNYVELLKDKGHPVNYAKRHEREQHGQYDFYSIMHYPVNGELDDGEQISVKHRFSRLDVHRVGNSDKLSPGDIAAAKYLYELSLQVSRPYRQASSVAASRGYASSSLGAGASHKPEWQGLLEEGDAYFWKENYDEALGCYQELRKRYARHFSRDEKAYLHNASGLCHLYNAKFWAALKQFQAARELCPEDSDFIEHYQIASQAIQDSRRQSRQRHSIAASRGYASSSLGAGASHKPKWQDLLEKGDAYFEKKNYDEALECYQKLLESHARHFGKLDKAHLFNSCGVCYFEKNQYDEALESFLEARELYPKHRIFRNNHKETHQKIALQNLSPSRRREALYSEVESQIAEHSVYTRLR